MFDVLRFLFTVNFKIKTIPVAIINEQADSARNIFSLQKMSKVIKKTSIEEKLPMQDNNEIKKDDLKLLFVNFLLILVSMFFMIFILLFIHLADFNIGNRIFWNKNCAVKRCFQ